MGESPPPHPAVQRLRQCDAYHHIPFRPVPVKARHDGWTPERQRGFIDRLVLTGCVAISARAVGKTPQSAYRLREHAGAASFRRAWDLAIESGESHMIDVAMANSLTGIIVPTMRLGRCVGQVYRYDNRLAMRALTAMDRRAARSNGRDPLAVLDRYLDMLDAHARRSSIDKDSVEK